MQLGAIPITAFKSMSGRETRVLHSDTPTDHMLSLSFLNRSGADGDLIVQHWNDRLGVALDFELPPEIWVGWSQYANSIQPGQKWRYSKQPAVDSVAPGVVSISVELVGLS